MNHFQILQEIARLQNELKDLAAANPDATDEDLAPMRKAIVEDIKRFQDLRDGKPIPDEPPVEKEDLPDPEA